MTIPLSSNRWQTDDWKLGPITFNHTWYNIYVARGSGLCASTGTVIWWRARIDPALQENKRCRFEAKKKWHCKISFDAVILICNTSSSKSISGDQTPNPDHLWALDRDGDKERVIQGQRQRDPARKPTNPDHRWALNRDRDKERVIRRQRQRDPTTRKGGLAMRKRDPTGKPTNGSSRKPTRGVRGFPEREIQLSVTGSEALWRDPDREFCGRIWLSIAGSGDLWSDPALCRRIGRFVAGSGSLSPNRELCGRFSLSLSPSQSETRRWSGFRRLVAE
jgi:hypothetical protein